MSDDTQVPPSVEIIDHIIDLHEQAHGPALKRWDCPCGRAYVIICTHCNSIVFDGVEDVDAQCEHSRMMRKLAR